MLRRDLDSRIRLILIVLGIGVSAVLLHQFLMVRSRLQQQKQQHEGFRATDTLVEAEERMSPEVFSYNLLQAVKGPIKRLSSQLLDMGSWRERVELATLSPVELARRRLKGTPN